MTDEQTPATPPSGEKLQKVLARLGLGSRRELERWISEGRVSVNGKVARLGDRVDDSDTLRVDGKVVGEKREERPRTRVIRYHKPVGEVCTRDDPEGRATVFDNLPRLQHGRWVQIGRLDLNTSGLLLFTNDGELANRLMHPSNTVEREYAVRILGEVDAEMLQRLRTGVELDDGPAHFDQLVDAGGEGANHWYHAVLKEGRNREVRRLWESQGLTVSRLQRVRYGSVSLPRWLKPGRWDELEFRDLKTLMQGVDMRAPPPKRSGRDDAQKARRGKPPSTTRRKRR